MSTNYYLKIKGQEPKHIGKSSAGWCFTLRVYPSDGIHNLVDWIKHIITLDKPKIKDEYGEKLTLRELLAQITERSRSEPGNLHLAEKNGAVKGPNNLARHKIDQFCIGHGEGTWDYVIGEFS
jgi:hypothetical protein